MFIELDHLPIYQSILYFLPELKGAKDYSTPINIDKIEIAEDMCATQPQTKGCCPAFKDLAEMIMEMSD